jgi:hypothetical protein
MRELVLRGVCQPWLLELRPGRCRIGRGAANEFCVDDVSISGSHCELTVSDDSALVKDLGSTNGTFINGVAIREAVLIPGQVLRLGSAELRLDFESRIQPEVRVTIPAITIESPRTHGLLPDGRPSCLNHANVPATFKCLKCEETFCFDCIHVVGLEGGQPMRFCPVCSGGCEVLAVPNARSRSAELELGPTSILRRMTKTLKRAFRRKRS